jgi:hypothetical protein
VKEDGLVKRKHGRVLPLLEHAEGYPPTFLCTISNSRASSGWLCPVLPYRIVLINPHLGAEIRKTSEELATAPGVVLFMQQMQHDEPSACPPPLPSPTGMHLDAQESPHGGDHRKMLHPSRVMLA